MKKPVIITIIITAVVMTLLIGSIMAFYTIPFADANNWLIVLNKNPATSTHQPQVLLKIVEDEFLTENHHSDIRSKKDISIEAWDKISIHYNIHIEIHDWDSWEIVKEYDKKVTVTYLFYNGAWQCIQAQKNPPLGEMSIVCID